MGNLNSLSLVNINVVVMNIRSITCSEVTLHL